MSDLSAIRATAARHHFQTLNFLAHGFLEDGVGQEDQSVRAGVGMVVLTGFAWTEYARLCGVHRGSFPVVRAPGCLQHSRGLLHYPTLSFILAVFEYFATI